MSVATQQAASDALVTGVQMMVEQLRLAANDPADAIRIISGLADFGNENVSAGTTEVTQTPIYLADPTGLIDFVDDETGDFLITGFDTTYLYVTTGSQTLVSESTIYLTTEDGVTDLVDDDTGSLLTNGTETTYTYTTPTATVGAPTASEMTTSMCRRAALTSLARATASYSPTSSNDVAAILSAITPLYDNEISYAGDIGDDASFQQLRALRSAVVTDLQTRGASLPELITITRNASLPSFVIAQQQDPERRPER